MIKETFINLLASRVLTSQLPNISDKPPSAIAKLRYPGRWKERQMMHIVHRRLDLLSHMHTCSRPSPRKLGYKSRLSRRALEPHNETGHFGSVFELPNMQDGGWLLISKIYPKQPAVASVRIADKTAIYYLASQCELSASEEVSQSPFAALHCNFRSSTLVFVDLIASQPWWFRLLLAQVGVRQRRPFVLLPMNVSSRILRRIG